VLLRLSQEHAARRHSAAQPIRLPDDGLSLVALLVARTHIYDGRVTDLSSRSCASNSWWQRRAWSAPQFDGVSVFIIRIRSV
jgi:hypothetical protein